MNEIYCIGLDIDGAFLRERMFLHVPRPGAD